MCLSAKSHTDSMVDTLDEPLFHIYILYQKSHTQSEDTDNSFIFLISIEYTSDKYSQLPLL